MATKKYIYSLKDATELDKKTVGGKGFYLGQLNKLKTKLELPFDVPEAQILSTDLWKEYSKSPKKAIALIKEEIVPQLLKSIKKNTLFSVRSGAPESMPGMMDTVLNFGINMDNVEDFAKINKDWAYDCLKRYLTMYGSIVLNIDKEQLYKFSNKKYKNKEEIEKDFGPIYKKHKKNLPDSNIEEQLFLCIEAVLKSWNSERAISYRDFHHMDHFMGTAIVFQKMVFGNKNDNSATAVVFSRDITTGDSAVMGEFKINAQGEDVVAGNAEEGIQELSEMFSWNKQIHSDIKKIAKSLEEHFKDVQDIELTIEDGKLYLLQTRTAKRTPQASIKIALDMYNDGLIDAKEVFNRVSLKDYLSLNLKKVDDGYNISPDGNGLPASNGVIVGPVILDARHLDDIENPSGSILLAKETTPDDMPIMKEVGAIYTASGGVTSHAAVVARSLNKICVVGSSDLKIYKEGSIDKWYATIGGKKVVAGEMITIDGFNGKVWVGNDVPITDGQTNKGLLKLEDLFFEAYPIIRAVSNHDDIFSDKDTIYATYNLDDSGEPKMKEALFTAMEIMEDFVESEEKSKENYFAIIDLRGKTDFASLFSGEEFIFSDGVGLDAIERKINVLSKYSGGRENFSIYLGKYEKQFKDKVEELGFKVIPEKQMQIKFGKEKIVSNDKMIQIIDKFSEDVLSSNTKIAISGKNALLSTLK